MLDGLLLLSGNDIPFIKANLTIHNPTLKEIGYVGEENFLNGYQLLNVSKNFLPEQDKINLDTISNFDILIAILRERNAVMQKNRSCVFMALALLFPSYAISLKNDSIALKKEGTEEECYLNRDNYEEFQQIIKQMFSFGLGDQESDFNPSGQLATRIAERLRKRHEKLAKLDKESTKVDIYSRYASILSIGLQQNLDNILNYTPYQLFDQIERYRLKQDYNIYIEAKMAGAKDMKDPED
jgi:hypothetical protein